MGKIHAAKGFITFTVLLIDDDEDDACLLQAALKKAGLPVSITWLRAGKTALDYLAHCKQAPDLVLLDLIMPEVSGFDVLTWLKEQSRFAFVPVTILTCSADPADQQKAAALGANGYIDKTPHFEKALAAISTASAARTARLNQSSQSTSPDNEGHRPLPPSGT